jgi:hypothetical protein
MKLRRLILIATAAALAAVTSQGVRLLGLLGEKKRRPDREMPSLQRLFVAWEADALPTELFPLNDLRRSRKARPSPGLSRS